MVEFPYFILVSTALVFYSADINECRLGLHNCDVHAICTNTVGGFECSCKHGYSGDGTVCHLAPANPCGESEMETT